MADLTSADPPAVPSKALIVPEGIPPAPHVVVVLLDQVGFGATSPFGGPIRMRVAERLAAEGIRYTRFHTAGSGVTTRAALLTGRSAGRLCTRSGTPPGGGPGPEVMVRPPGIAPLAEILRRGGYATAQFGRCAEVPPWEAGPAGPFDRWPTNSGFDHFYGFLGATTHRYYPALFEDTTPVDVDGGPDRGYHLTEDLADHAIDWVHRQLSLAAVRPLFLYFSPGAGHAPHQVPAQWTEPYWGQFDAGWEALRALTARRQRELGLWPDGNAPSPAGPVPAGPVPAGSIGSRWDEAPRELRPVLARQMEVYAAMLEHADHQVGRVLDAFAHFGALPDTMVWYLLGDSGASTSGTAWGTTNTAYARNGFGRLETLHQRLATMTDLGGPTCFNHYAIGWAQALCTPYRRDASPNAYWGRTRTGLVVRWPRGFAGGHGVRHQFHHVVDVPATVCAVAGVRPAARIDGVPQQPMDGVSMCYTGRDESAPDRRVEQGFEADGLRAYYRAGHVLVTVPPRRSAGIVPAPAGYELFGPDDWAQRYDIAAERPDLVRELSVAMSQAPAGQVAAPPPADRLATHPGWPPVHMSAASQVLLPGMGHLNEGTVLDTRNRSHTVNAVVLVPADRANGVIVAHGGIGGGWALYLVGGRLRYCYNLLGRWLFYVGAKRVLPSGEHLVRAQFAYDGGGPGRGGTVCLFVDGHRVGRGRVDATHPIEYSPDASTGIGRGTQSPITPDYRHPGVLTGVVLSVRLEVDHLIPLAEEPGRVTRPHHERRVLRWRG